MLLDGEAGSADGRRASSTGPPTARRRRRAPTRRSCSSAGAVGSPQILLLSGIGPRRELEAVGVPCQLDSPDVGKHLKDHLQVGLFFPAPGVGHLDDRDRHLDGPRRAAGARRTAAGRPADDDDLPDELKALKAEAERRVDRVGDHRAAGSCRRRSTTPCAWFSTGLGDDHTHDAQIGFFACGYNADIWQRCLRVDPDEYFDDPARAPGPRRRER